MFFCMYFRLSNLILRFILNRYYFYHLSFHHYSFVIYFQILWSQFFLTLRIFLALLGSLFFNVNFQISRSRLTCTVQSKSLKNYFAVSPGIYKLAQGILPFHVLSSMIMVYPLCVPWLHFTCFLYLDLATFLIKFIDFSFLLML